MPELNAAAAPVPEPSASFIAAFFGRATLRAGNYPGRRFLGSLLRKKSRLGGGRSFYVTGHDGTRLAAWFSPATGSAASPEGGKAGLAGPARNGPPSRLPILLSHGWCEIKEFHFPRAERLNRLGHDVVLFDHRGHGRSGGKHVTFGVHERRDAAAVADAAIERGFIGDRFITLGFSLGAATVLQHAAIDPRVDRVVAIAPFVDFRTAILSFRDCLAPWMRNDAWLIRGFEKATRDHGFNLADATTFDAMRHITAPVLLIEGGRDHNLPPRSHTQKLIPAKCNGELKVVTLDRASHRAAGHHPWPDLEDHIAAFCAPPA